jgi:PAS domain S-box-containing protein
VNINKLFPRLSIRMKLAIAFVLLAIVPLAAVTIFATRVTVHHVRALAKASLEHELETARQQAEQSLQEVERQVTYLAHAVVGPLLDQTSPVRWEAAKRSISAFLSFTPALFQVKAVDAHGRVLLVAPDAGTPTSGGEETGAGGVYYALRAKSLKPGQRLMLPVELRSGLGAGGAVRTVPAVAFVLPVRDSSGIVVGTVVGEAYASVLFAGLEGGSPHLKGSTGLIGADGLFVYHSAYKRDWSRLLAARSDIDLQQDLSEDLVGAVLTGQAGTLPASNRRIISFVPLHLTDPGIGPLMLYRIVPLSAVEAPVRQILTWVPIGGVAVLFLVLGLAVLATHQLTQPIYKLREGARRLAEGHQDIPLEIATNDELEDLATDFSAMAQSLHRHQQELEELVTERTQALREAHAELTGILEYSADAIVGLDLSGRIRVWNKGAESLFGYAAVEAIGQDYVALLQPSGANSTAEASFIQRELANHGVLIDLQTSRTPKNGDPFSVGLTQTVIRDENNQPLGYSLIIRDTRLQTKLQEQMRRSDRLAAVSLMAAGLAHELNNPLAIIGNRIECMEHEVRERCHDCFLEKDLAVLREHTHRMSEVTQDLLAFAREGNDKTELVALDGVVARVAKLLERVYATRSVRLEIAEGGEVPSVAGNEKAFETVCMNLLLNAADATPPGGHVLVQTRRTHGGDAVELEVRDTGPGVPLELQHRIFEPFFTTKESDRGTGLGLAVCRSIVERQGGEIWVESGAGGGSRFLVLLPTENLERPWTRQESS